VTRLFGYQVMITTTDGKPDPKMLLLGMYPGTKEEILKLIEPLTALAKPEKLDPYYGTYNTLNATLVDQILPGPGTPGTLELKRCGYIAKPLGVDGWGAICSYMQRVQPNPYNMTYLEVYGGAIDDLPPLSNAFIHRGVDCNLAVDAFYNPNWDSTYPEAQSEEQAQAWLDGLWELVGPLTNGHVYQDYPDSNYKDYRWQYWGDAFPTLLEVKQRYDPTGLFVYGQPITPYPDGPGVTRSTHPPLF
jgi:hypothetical protein